MPKRKLQVPSTTEAHLKKWLHPNSIDDHVYFSKKPFQVLVVRQDFKKTLKKIKSAGIPVKEGEWLVNWIAHKSDDNKWRLHHIGTSTLQYYTELIEDPARINLDERELEFYGKEAEGLIAKLSVALGNVKKS